MFGVLGILILSAILFAWELKPLMKQGSKRDLWAFSVMMAIATGLMIAEVLGINIPNPSEGLAVIFSPVGEWLKVE